MAPTGNGAKVKDGPATGGPRRSSVGVDEPEPSDGATAWLIDRVLDTVRAHVGLDLAYLTAIDPHHQHVQAVSGPAEEFGLVPGTAFPLNETLCRQMLDGLLPNVVDDVRSHPASRELSAATATRVGTYLAVPVRRPGGHLHGTMCCVSREPNALVGARDVQFMGALAQLISDHLDRYHDESVEDDLVARIDRFCAGDGLEVHFQPIIDVREGRVVGAEALARFSDGAPATVWFANAARLGRDVELESTALLRALSHLDELPVGVDIYLNASPGLLLDRRLEGWLSKVPGPRLVLELTEHFAVADYEGLASHLAPLRERGVRLAIDDLGSGFANFRHVAGLGPDVLKLDSTLTAGLGEEPIVRALVTSVVRLAGRIGATVVAEGVQDTGTLDALRELGVHQAQGFLLGPPATLPFAEPFAGSE